MMTLRSQLPRGRRGSIRGACDPARRVSSSVRAFVMMLPIEATGEEGGHDAGGSKVG
jgi:hypothetical protein